MATSTAAAMKPTLFLHKSSLKWNPFLHMPNPFQPLFGSPAMKPVKISSRKSSGLGLKCFFASISSNSTVSKKELLAEKVQENPLERFAKIIVKALKVLQKPAVAAVVVGLLLMYDPNSALAASGGRVGGQSFSSRSSYSSSSRSYSVPRTSGGMSFSYSAAYYAPSPFGFGGNGVYVGPAVGVGSSFFLIMVGFAAFILVSGFLSDKSEDGVLTATEKTSVLKLQVTL